ncbi:MAG: NAD(P)/FAD-dependent oxidoreductase [Methanobacterium sp.]|uniref:NAD(P)/FAD-dependent oxidoreductase n=1 Tax=Methanobacterium sp. TaxID=2164 RepID=UPI003D64E9C4|nr:NAD(P)/FAD-dependent oxidoreductase [Methanobacterium sp.]
MKYDVVVVGGRVAGSVSSLFASKNDVDVLMIEKRPEIGVPLQCAEATSEVTFQTLGIKPSSKYIRSEIYGADIHSPDGNSFRMDPSNENGYILDRKLFDKSLAVESAKAGTEIMVKTTVKDLIIKDGKIKGVVAKHMGKTIEIEADMVIAADGIESNVARMAGLNSLWDVNDLCSCVQYKMAGIETDPNYMQFYFGNEIAPGGYVWIFPNENGVANVGIGVRSSKKTAYEYLNKFTSNLGGTPIEINVGGVPVSGNIEKTYADGLLVVGDAAGHVDPITGGGIHFATICAKIAGKVAANAIKNEDVSEKSLEVYEKSWKNEIERDIKRSLKYRKIMEKLSDNELNALARFMQKNEGKSISAKSLLGLAKESPSLFRVLKDII